MKFTKRLSYLRQNLLYIDSDMMKDPFLLNTSKFLPDYKALHFSVNIEYSSNTWPTHYFSVSLIKTF